MSRSIAFLLALLFHAMSFAAPGTSFGMHGMVLFGSSEELYVSHLPMFHAPHDVQVVARVRLADASLDAAMRRELARSRALWTVAPERFELDRMAPGADNPLTTFTADLVQGHFERDGVTRHGGIRLVVEQVLIYRKLGTPDAPGSSARFLQVGKGAQRFLVKQIDSRPDMDHIVAIAVRRGTSSRPITVARDGLMPTAGNMIEKALPGAAVLGTVWFETADLR